MPANTDTGFYALAEKIKLEAGKVGLSVLSKLIHIQRLINNNNNNNIYLYHKEK